jgi:hypothetical protein
MIPLCNAYVALSGPNYACVGSNSDRPLLWCVLQHRFCVLYMVNSLGTRRPDHASRIYGLVCLACWLARPSSSHTVAYTTISSTVITSLLYVIDVTIVRGPTSRSTSRGPRVGVVPVLTPVPHCFGAVQRRPLGNGSNDSHLGL